MVTMAQRIEALRNEKGLSRPALAAELGFPKNAIEKYETGRATPTKDQQEKMASYFGVSLFYLKGESDDPTRQDSWMTAALSGGCSTDPISLLKIAGVDMSTPAPVDQALALFGDLIGQLEELAS